MNKNQCLKKIKETNKVRYQCNYHSPLGNIILGSDGTHLLSLQLENSRYYVTKKATVKEELPVFQKTKEWLDAYFEQKNPSYESLNLLPQGTDFQKQVWQYLLTIPYGTTASYRDVAKEIAKKQHKNSMSSQAVGNAIGHNPIMIIIPCHRVVGATGNLTGYAGGLEAKSKLLTLEGVDMSKLYLPKEKNKQQEKTPISRCSWCNLENERYIKYHDEEWGSSNFEEHYLFEMLILESFQAGLSWECVLNKRENFRRAFDNFDLEKISRYQEDKIESLMDNSGIIRNRRKIIAAIINAQIFKEIAQEFGSFRQYLFTFTEGKTVYENDKTHSELSDKMSKDLRQRGMKFVGTTIIYSYLQAIGVINSHEENCFLFSKTDTSSKNSKKTRFLKGNN